MEEGLANNKGVRQNLAESGFPVQQLKIGKVIQRKAGKQGDRQFYGANDRQTSLSLCK